MRSDDRRAYCIELPKLNNGVNTFRFEVGKQFFQGFEQPLIQTGNVVADVEIRKSLNQLDAHFTFTGEVELICDRCNIEYNFPLRTECRLIYAYKEGGVREEEEIEVVYMDPNNHLLDLSQELYDYICLEIPIRKVPEDCGEDCPRNPLAGFSASEDSEEGLQTDPRWAALKNLRNDELN